MGNEEKLEELKEKKRIANLIYKGKVKQNVVKSKEFREKSAHQKRQWRAAQQAQLQQGDTIAIVQSRDSSQSTSTFKSASSKSKAIKKCENALPKDEEMKKEIIKCVAKRNDVATVLLPDVPIKRPRKGFAEIEKFVLDFYMSDVVSRTNPGIRDFIRIKKKDKTWEYKQTFTLTMTLDEAYLEFKKLFPDVGIHRSKFIALRPSHVLLYSHVKHETCLCSYCENFHLLLESLSKFMDAKYTSKDLLTKFCCDSDNYECASGNCNECKEFMEEMNTLMATDSLEKSTNYLQWTKDESFYQRKEIQDVRVEDLLKKFEKDFKYLKLHKYIANTQKTALKNSIENLNEDEVIIIVDFSERFITKANREIQSSYFGKKLISIYTARMYVGQQAFSFVIASDNQAQSKYTVFAYMQALIERAKEINPNIQRVNIFSDGCAMQFKNRFNIWNLLYADEDFGVSLEWHFFSTSHGKSACDGIGGIVKRAVHKRVISNSHQVYNAREFVETASKCCQNTTIFEMTTDEINARSNNLHARWEPEKDYKKIPGIQSFHYFKCSTNYRVINASITSREESSKEFNLL